MKKLLLITLAILLSFSLFGKPRELNPAIVDAKVTDWILDQLRGMGYTILPEVIVQDTLNKNKQRFSSRYETKGGRGYLLPNWANDSTWYPGQRPPKKEWDDLYYTPSKDGKKHQHRNKVDQIVDTLVKENPDIQVNNYYDNDPFFYSNRIGMFYHGGFNYWHYNPFFYDPWDFDFGWGWNPYYGYNYPYWSYPYYSGFYFGYNNYYGWNFGWNWYHPYYQPYYHNNYWYGGHNNFYSNNHQQPQYSRRERPSNLTNNQIDNRRIQPQQRREITSQQRMNPQDKPMYQQNRRSYTPSYENPRLGVRPQYNNSKPDALGRQYERRTETSTQSRTFSPSNMQRSTQTRTYQQTNRSQNYTAPSRSYSPPPNRSSEPQGFGRTFNFNSGGDRRNSGSSNFSSGSNNSGGSSNSGSRSSGGSTTSTGRR